MSQYESKFEEKLYNERREKLAQIAAIARTLNPALTEAEARYPNAFPTTATVPQLRALGHNGALDPLSAEELAATHIEAAIAGRVMAIRVQGKAGFAQLQQHGERLQLYVRKDDVGEPLFNLYKLLDLGDHIGVRGFLMRTRTGELTLHAAPITLPGHAGQPALTLLTKAMLALPDKYHGLEDVELRYRRRYVDLIVNSGTREAATPATGATTTPGAPSSTLSLSSEPGAPGPDSRTRAEPPPPQMETTELNLREASTEGAGGFSPLNTVPQQGALAPGLSATEPTDTPTNVRDVFVKRAHILRSIRHFFDTRGYLEVETPMLHTISGGAAARPFETHHNALDIPLKLRIAPELYLKRLVVGGLDRVYEINRNFRNEGVSTQHNPEFTMLEFYQAYANYHDLMNLTQELITHVAQEVNGTTLTTFNNTEIDLSKWTKLSMRDAIIEFWDKTFCAPPEIEDLKDPKKLLIFLGKSALELSILEQKSASWALEGGDSDAEMRNITASQIATFAENLRRYVDFLSSGVPAGKVIAALFEGVAETELIQPTIIYDFPLAVSPLSKVKPNEPDWVERFEFYIGGFEVGNAFSELNDPDDQHRRFEAQLAEKARGDDEAMSMDEDFVRALGYGLPPTAGEGIGIDRLTMILTGSRSIRDVILFPLMRPPKPTPDPAE